MGNVTPAPGLHGFSEPNRPSGVYLYPLETIDETAAIWTAQPLSYAAVRDSDLILLRASRFSAATAEMYELNSSSFRSLRDDKHDRIACSAQCILAIVQFGPIDALRAQPNLLSLIDYR